MPVFGGHIAATFGLVLGTALVAGLIADFLRLPKVIAYLLVGILLGPSLLNLLAEHHVQALHPLTQLAMGLVLFSLGCHFPFSYVRRIARPVIRLSAGELAATFALVCLGLVAVGQSWPVALLLGALALATAPATTILVLKETESEGPVTEYASALVVVNNFVAIVVFELVFLGIHMVQGQPAATGLHVQVGLLVEDIFGSVASGVLAGLIVSYACGILATGWWLVLLVAATSFLLGVDEILGIPYMLGFLAMGVTVANTSDGAKQIVAGLDQLTGFLCVIFFVLNGAELDLGAFVQAGFLGGAYIVCRSCGKYLGIFAAARLAGEPPPVRKWLGSTMLAQAGAAIALSSVAAGRDAELGGRVQTVILGTVVFFEIAGPLLIRESILRAGEVPLMQAVHHSSSTLLSELRTLSTRLFIALGADPARKRNPQQFTVQDLVRRNVPPLSQSASFDELIALIEHSHDNTYAVVDDDSVVVGVIHYADLSHALFDREVASLVRAIDLAVPAELVLYADQPAADALKLFRSSRDDCIPVVDRQAPHRFVGVVRRRDLVGYLLRQGAEADR